MRALFPPFPFRAAILAAAVGILAAIPVPAAAQNNKEDVNIKITVRAHDALFIGTAMGGAHVTVRDRRTGDILADGITYGATGDRKAVMEDGFKRDAVLVNDDTADLQFALALFEPTPVTITASAPLAQGQSTVAVSQDYTLIPGKDYESGNGILIDMPGFAVDVVSPPVAARAKLDPDKPVELVAYVAKLCGCKIDDKGPWPVDRYEVDAHVYKDTTFITSVKMRYGDEPGKFVANMKFPVAGTYRIMVSAFDPQTKEGGSDTTSITLE
jgi:hypothetical protein